MTLVERIQKFLHQKSIKPTKANQATKEDKGKRKDFIQNSNIHKSTISKIVNSSKRNPKINTIIDIAKCFHCTTDEVLFRENYFIVSKEYKFNDISLGRVIKLTRLPKQRDKLPLRSFEQFYRNVLQLLDIV